MMKILKYFLFSFIFLNLYSEVHIQAKPIPPGSGEGDVPANILFLIDSSASMSRRINNRNAVFGVTGVGYDSNDDIIGGQSRNLAVVKFDADGTRNREFGNNTARWTGAKEDTCEAGLSFDMGGGTGYSSIERDTRTKAGAKIRVVEDMSTNDGTISNETIVFFTSTLKPLRGDIIGMSEDGTDCRFYLNPSAMQVRAMDIATIDGEVYLFAIGRWGRNSAFVSYNLTRGIMGPVSDLGRNGNSSTPRYNFRHSIRIAVNSDASILYVARYHLFGFALEKVGNVYQLTGGANAMCIRCYTADNSGNLDTQLVPVNGIDVSPEDDSVLYTTSMYRHVVQKLSLDGTTTGYSVVARAGTGSRELGMNTEDTGELAADKVRFSYPNSIHVTNDKILVGSSSGTIDEFNENLFNSTNKDTAWLQQMGGGAVSRWTGVKQAMATIISDTTLTSGAHFGYGHWNAGETGKHKKRGRGGRFCHFNDSCNYYGGWTGTQTDGRSTQCNRDSCLNVGISSEGYTRILDHLLPQRLAWGTDSRAFAQMAHEYYTKDFEGYDPDSECQLNYVIVIGDGMFMNNDSAATEIAKLRGLENPVVTLFVAYGGGINPVGMDRFKQLADAGSCPGNDSTHPDCEPVIEAATPVELKTQLTSKIRQILAEKLSFTAPSITATVQEGGSLYQAQFAYEQYGEWHGTILRKKLNPDNTVEHDTKPGNEFGNWDAAREVRLQAAAEGGADTRKIWSAMPDANYIGNWDNFNTGNIDSITELFGLLEYSVLDYHNTSSHCADRGGHVGENGHEDDAKGLVNFMLGTDYFDYNGDCNVTQKREHVLGDIYHSQLVEIGAPDASTDFTSPNEEAYFRSANNYQNFRKNNLDRKKIIYAGSNSGMLHAINAETGIEEWAFVPPFVAGIMPSIINPDLDGAVDVTFDDDGNRIAKGGTNAIFGVDGSPVVHDVFMAGYDESGTLDTTKAWRTILMIPYGRGGAGFSVLDVTSPTKPIHMYSIFNDSINNKVLFADNEGSIIEHPYSSGSASIGDSLEGQQATKNYNNARDDDTENCGEEGEAACTNQDAIAACQTNAEAGGSFHVTGTNSCYLGSTFTFEGLTPHAPDGVTVPKSNLKITERVAGTLKTIDFDSAKYVSGQLVVTFGADKIFAASGSVLINEGTDDEEEKATNAFNIATSCTSASGIDPKYDYSQLGETWSTPRIVRIPSELKGERGNYKKDTYVAVMGAGMGATNLCAGSAVYLVNLEDMDNPGSIFGAEANGGPITIVDTDPAGILTEAGVMETPYGSDIGNSLPSSAVVITPDTAFNIPWRGAMVYFNDLEGKITKINLTSSTENTAELFDQTTLFRLNANTENRRYSYFSMDAGIGATTRDFWLFGGTGNFGNIGGGSKNMDNILYGVRDPHYPYFKHLNGVHVPPESDTNFIKTAHEGANAAKSVDDGVVCVNTTGKVTCQHGPGPGDLAWRIHLDTVDGLSPNNPLTLNTYRKLSAAPTLFKGQVYFPIYEPPPGTNPCNIGMAYICVADDECGSNNSHLLTRGGVANGKKCKQVREGILSELVIFGDTLFANVAGPKDDEDTLYKVLAAAGEVQSSRGSWRESGF